jgi:phosphoribosylformylglycinamidine synthase
MAIRCFIISPRAADDPRAVGLLADAHALGFTPLTQIQVHDLYFVQGDLSAHELQRLVTELISDPIVQAWRVDDKRSNEANVIERALRPGVTDPVAEQIVRGARELGIAGVERASTGQRFVIQSPSPLSETELRTLARALLVNPVIHHYALGSLEPIFPQAAEASSRVEILPVRECADDELLALSRDRRAALDLNEMRAIQNYFRTVGREPTDVEIEMIAQTWSEHCGHKTFKAKVSIQKTSDSIYRSEKRRPESR